MNNKIERIKELVDECNKYSIEYYKLSNPSVSDKEYDEKYYELLNLEKETGVVLPYSPTQRIGDVILDKFEKHDHKFKCYSMDKSNTYEELVDWDKKNRVFVKQNNLLKIQYVVAKKFDGLTINNTYDNQGILITSATRGTGERGELITSQTKTIKSIPLKINYDKLIEVHGEALMTKKQFELYNKTVEVPLKNLRNGAAGAIKNLNVKETSKKNLSAFFYDIGYTEGEKFKTYMDMMKFIEEMGFPIDKEYYLCDTIEEVKEKIDLIEEIRPNLDYEIDGAIISINDIQTRDLMGYTVKFPKWAIAYKYEAEETTTTILDVEFNTGRTGKVTPRAKIEPVELMGAVVKYATLNSMDDIKRKGVRIGAEAFVRRSNDVIPEILGVVEDSITEDMKEIQMPKVCQSCGSPLIKDGVHYFCENSLNCRPQIVKGIAHFGSLEAMNIDGFSQKTADLFVDNKVIETVLDMYNLESKKDVIIKLPKFAVNKYNNLIESVNNSKKCKLENFIYALGIPSVGKSTSRELVKFANCENPDDALLFISTVPYDHLLKMKDCGDTTAQSIVDYFANDKNEKMLRELLKYIEFEREEVNIMDSNKEGIFKGMKIYCTGSFSSHKKEELKEIVESLGGEFANGYLKSLSMLVVGSLKGSGKVAKAEADGVKVLQEDQFLKMIGE